MKIVVVAFSDHSDFDGLMEYARRSKPKLVITDNFRIGYAEAMVKEIRKRFGISALALPKKWKLLSSGLWAPRIFR